MSRPEYACDVNPFPTTLDANLFANTQSPTIDKDQVVLLLEQLDPSFACDGKATELLVRMMQMNLGRYASKTGLQPPGCALTATVTNMASGKWLQKAGTPSFFTEKLLSGRTHCTPRLNSVVTRKTHPRRFSRTYSQAQMRAVSPSSFFLACQGTECAGQCHVEASHNSQHKTRKRRGRQRSVVFYCLFDRAEKLFLTGARS